RMLGLLRLQSTCTPPPSSHHTHLHLPERFALAISPSSRSSRFCTRRHVCDHSFFGAPMCDVAPGRPIASSFFFATLHVVVDNLLCAATRKVDRKLRVVNFGHGALTKLRMGDVIPDCKRTDVRDGGGRRRL